jgi:hypothetical protein
MTDISAWAEVSARLKLPAENFNPVDRAENHHVIDRKIQPG